MIFEHVGVLALRRTGTSKASPAIIPSPLPTAHHQISHIVLYFPSSRYMPYKYNGAVTCQFRPHDDTTTLAMIPTHLSFASRRCQWQKKKTKKKRPRCFTSFSIFFLKISRPSSSRLLMFRLVFVKKRKGTTPNQTKTDRPDRSLHAILTQASRYDTLNAASRASRDIHAV